MTTLLPFIVLRDDPRWAQCVAEIQRLLLIGKGITGLDTEFWECPRLRGEAEATGRDCGKRDNFDPWSTRLRCLQIGLPSGLVMLLDFGRCFDGLSYADYMQHRRCRTPFDDILPLIGQLLAHRGIAKVGWSLSTEALILRRHFGWKLRCGRDGMLASQVLWAGVGSKKQRFTETGLVACEVLSHAFKATAERVGVEMDKGEQLSDWSAAELSVAQLNYVALDVHRSTLIETWRRLAEQAKSEGVWESVVIECEAAPAFWECEWRGTPHDAEKCSELAAQYKRAGDALYGEVSAALGGVPVEGDGSQQATAIGLTCWLRRNGYPDACLYRWERVSEDGKKEVRRGVDMTLDEARPEIPPKPKKPTGKPKPPTLPKKWTTRCTEADYKAKCEEHEAALAEHAAFVADYEEELAAWEALKNAPRWQFRPEMGEAALAPYDSTAVVSALMEARSCRSTQGVLEKRQLNSWTFADGRMATRCRYWQIAGGFDGGRGESSGSGAGTGRSSSSKPLNNQNVTTYPLGKKRCRELGLGNVRSCVRPPSGRAMLVGDFSQAHMRIFAQVSRDPALLEDFNAGRDAHIRLARDFYRAANPGAELGEKSFAEWCDIYQAGKDHPLYDAIKEPRIPSKNGNYSYLNMGGAQKVRQIAETSPDPIHLPATIEVDGEERDPWEVIQKRWRETYSTGYKYQRFTIDAANRESHSFDFCDGEYGAVWSCDGKRRLYLLKEWNLPKWAESPEDGRYGVKGTEALAGIMQMSEANALKIALALIVEEFDAHDNEYLAQLGAPLVLDDWGAYIFNIVHDETDAECDAAYKVDVAECQHRCMQEGLRRAGIVDLPTCAPDDSSEKLVVKSWADK